MMEIINKTVIRLKIRINETSQGELHWQLTLLHRSQSSL